MQTPAKETGALQPRRASGKMVGLALLSGSHLDSHAAR